MDKCPLCSQDCISMSTLLLHLHNHEQITLPIWLRMDENHDFIIYDKNMVIVWTSVLNGMPETSKRLLK